MMSVKKRCKAMDILSPNIFLKVVVVGIFCACVVVTCNDGVASSSSTPPTQQQQQQQRQRPNILLLLTDDQDVLVGGMDHMPLLQKYITDYGAVFENYFVHTPICCPSRSSILSGRYLHNGGARNNSLSGNCYGEFWRRHVEDKSYAVVAKSAGYRTAFAGKYLNQYGTTDKGEEEIQDCIKNNNDLTKRCGIVPKGWDHWLGLVGNSRYYNYTAVLSDNSGQTITLERHLDLYEDDYFPDVVANRTLDIIDEFTKNKETMTNDENHGVKHSPFLIAVSWPTPHSPFTAAPPDIGRFKGKKAHRTPNYNTTKESNLQKHWMMRRLAPIDEKSEKWIDDHYQMRSEALQSVDRHIELFAKKLEEAGQLDNTIIIYTSDNGWQFGQHRITGDKRQLYEHDIRVPMIIRGSKWIKAGRNILEPILNIDIAPTIAEMVTGDPQPPSYMDGQSFWPLLVKEHRHNSLEAMNETKAFSDKNIKSSAGGGNSYPYPWRHDFLVSYHGEAGGPCGMWICPPEPPSQYHGGDAWNNTYNCLRTLKFHERDSTSQSTRTRARGLVDSDTLNNINLVGTPMTSISIIENSIYCKFEDDEKFVEFYDLFYDPWQLHNAVNTLSPEQQFAYEARIETLKRCKGDTCRIS